MEKEVLKLVAQMVGPGADEEMIKLGQTIFAGNNPTAEDINTLNDFRGFEPIMFTYEGEQVMYAIKHAENHLFDIFADGEY